MEDPDKDNAVQNSTTEPLVVNDEAIFDAAFGPACAFDALHQVSCRGQWPWWVMMLSNQKETSFVKLLYCLDMSRLFIKLEYMLWKEV